MLKLRPITLKEANDFVRQFHRHHKPVVGHKLSLAVEDNGNICGVCICSRPIARMSDDGRTMEVTRLCTTGIKNACSLLYRAAWRVAKELGYNRLITYTMPSEGGASLRAAGFILVGERCGGSWNRHNRPREDKHPTGVKLLWEIKREIKTQDEPHHGTAQ